MLLVGTSVRLDDDGQLSSWPSDQRVPLSSGSEAWRAVVAGEDLVALDLREAAGWGGHPYLEAFLRAAGSRPDERARPAAHARSGEAALLVEHLRHHADTDDAADGEER